MDEILINLQATLPQWQWSKESEEDYQCTIKGTGLEALSDDKRFDIIVGYSFMNNYEIYHSPSRNPRYSGEFLRYCSAADVSLNIKLSLISRSRVIDIKEARLILRSLRGEVITRPK